MFSEDSILHGGVKTLTRTRQVRPFPGPCGLVASLVSVFHVQNVSFSSGVHTNSSALGMRLLFAIMLLRPAFRRLIKPQVQPCKLFGPRPYESTVQSFECLSCSMFSTLYAKPLGSTWSIFSRCIIYVFRALSGRVNTVNWWASMGLQNCDSPGKTRILLSPVTPQGASN